MTRRLVLLGGGGHGQVLLEALRRCGLDEVELADPQLSPDQARRLGFVPVTEQELLLLDPGAVELVNGIGSVGDPTTRRRVFDDHTARGFRFRTVVHPSAVVATDVQLEEGAQVMAGAVLQPGVVVGRNSLVNTGAIVDHHCQIGAHVHVAPGATLSGGVTVGDGAHVGTGASSVQGVRIGAGALVGAGATVIRDVPDGSRLVGAGPR